MQANYDQVTAERDKIHNAFDSLLKENQILEATVASLRDSVDILSFPSDQRYNQILSLVKSDSFDIAKAKIAELQEIFPNSAEASQCNEQLLIIEKKEESIRKELERIKALGYKAFPDKNVVYYKDSKCTYSNFSFSRTFTFEYVQDVNEYSYRTADKNNVYITASLNVRSDKRGYSPRLYVFSIENGELVYQGFFNEKYATYDTYGVSIGLYYDTLHDWDKVNSMNFKVACEISKELSQKPLVIAYANETESVDHNKRYSIEDAQKQLVIVKIINRNKL